MSHTDSLFSHMGDKGDGGSNSSSGSSSRDQIFKECYWFNSHSIPLDMQVGVSRLEFPVDIVINKDIEASELYLTAYILTNEVRVLIVLS